MASNTSSETRFWWAVSNLAKMLSNICLSIDEPVQARYQSFTECFTLLWLVCRHCVDICVEQIWWLLSVLFFRVYSFSVRWHCSQKAIFKQRKTDNMKSNPRRIWVIRSCTSYAKINLKKKVFLFIPGPQFRYNSTARAMELKCTSWIIGF